MTTTETIWFRDIAGFVSDANLSRFLPWPHTTTAEKLNAVLRFSIYYALFMFVLRRSVLALYVPLVTALVTYLVHRAETARDGSTRERMDALDVTMGVKGRVCTRPSKHNPFMNVLMTDYKRFPERPEACELAANSVSHKAERHFSRNLYRDSDDVYERNTNSRQFYTNPSTTIPNDQAGFAAWLYSSGPSCKEGNGDMCAVHLHKSYPGV
jgi:hypothetical protein